VARNDQVTRQWHLLRRLEDPRGATLQELGSSLPADMPRHLRTVRRDLEALEAAGFPLVTERVDGVTRWRLIGGFRRIPARSFSPTELMALAMGRDLLKPLDGTQLRVAVDSALAKIPSDLPPMGRDFVRQMRDFFSVGLGPHKTYARHREVVVRLSRAVTGHRTAQMRYYSASRDRVTRREVGPYHLWFAAGGLSRSGARLESTEEDHDHPD
jgi:predicted DNA-binding transcriptional regulator YafY